jgi:hypothetical protein
MFPHERSLVKRLENKPFALVGVNSDTDQGYLRLKREQDRTQNKSENDKALKDIDWEAFKKTLKEKNENQQITWRSFWNGREGTGGPISSKWNVQGWPTLYMIDHKGVIRHKFLGSPGEEKMNKLIDALVEKASPQ